MNNTKPTLAMFAVLIAATLVVGAFATTTVTQSAFAYPQKNKGGGEDENSKNGNTITIQKCKQAAIQSGFDNNQAQECENLICTHPSEICDQSTPSVAAQEQTALEITGQGTGGGLQQNIFCPDVTHSGGLGDITFSGTLQNGMFSGTFTILNSTNQVLLKSGSITSGNIQSGSYTVQGTETVDNLCSASTTVPTAITINGQCGTGVTINFRAANGETATFTGNVKCVSS
jgi:hypothetical protein